jgi:iron-sulfur cluster assembly protein
MIIVQSPVKVTPRAISEIKRILESKNIPADHGLRIGIRDAGSISASHILGFDLKNENDNEYVVEGITVYIQKNEISYLAGMTVDYYEAPEASGFTFIKS